MNDEKRWSCTDWEAWYPPEGPDVKTDGKLRVSAQCTFESGSITWKLEPTNEGVVDDPKLFVLRLTVDDPGIGTHDHVEKKIEWTDDDRAAGQGIECVEIRGDASEKIEVTRTQTT
jgi:hypothetical protein